MQTAVIRLSKPGKMPCATFSIPAEACRTGSKLAKIPGSVCSDCYALKGNYRFPNVKAPRAANLEQIMLAHSSGEWAPWIDAMVAAVAISTSSENRYFRWHDSGDIQSLAHLEAIAAVVRRLPRVKFWLPTKEKADVLAYARKYGDFPQNLTVRLSAPMIGGRATSSWPVTSTVHAVKGRPVFGAECRAYRNEGKCGSCRRCWDRNVANVSYPRH